MITALRHEKSTERRYATNSPPLDARNSTLKRDARGPRPTASGAILHSRERKSGYRGGNFAPSRDPGTCEYRSPSPSASDFREVDMHRRRATRQAAQKPRPETRSGRGPPPRSQAGVRDVPARRSSPWSNHPGRSGCSSERRNQSCKTTSISTSASSSVARSIVRGGANRMTWRCVSLARIPLA